MFIKDLKEELITSCKWWSIKNALDFCTFVVTSNTSNKLPWADFNGLFIVSWTFSFILSYKFEILLSARLKIFTHVNAS